VNDRQGDGWGGLLLVLVGLAIVVRTLKGSLTNRIGTLAGV
jgi:hypothetical protein